MNDLINRQSVLDIIDFEDKWLIHVKSHNGDTVTAFDSMISRVKDLLPVSTEKIGYWEKRSVGYGCSECSLCTNKNGIGFYRYCPNCGAKMKNLEHIDKTDENLLMRYAELIDSEDDPHINYVEIMEEEQQVREEILRRMKGGE